MELLLRIPFLSCALMSPLFFAVSRFLQQLQARERNHISRRCCSQNIPR